MKMKSISRLPFKYGGVLVHPNAEFSAKSERDAKMLVAVKRAALLTAKVVAEEPKPAPKRTYKRKDIAAAPVAKPVIAESEAVPEVVEEAIPISKEEEGDAPTVRI